MAAASAAARTTLVARFQATLAPSAGIGTGSRGSPNAQASGLTSRSDGDGREASGGSAAFGDRGDDRGRGSSAAAA